MQRKHVNKLDNGSWWLSVCDGSTGWSYVNERNIVNNHSLVETTKREQIEKTKYKNVSQTTLNVATLNLKFNLTTSWNDNGNSKQSCSWQYRTMSKFEVLKVLWKTTYNHPTCISRPRWGWFHRTYLMYHKNIESLGRVVCVIGRVAV